VKEKPAKAGFSLLMAHLIEKYLLEVRRILIHEQQSSCREHHQVKNLLRHLHSLHRL
jgi:hypothetical protein